MAKITVILTGNDIVSFSEDDKAGAAIMPGMLVNYNGSGDLIPHGTAGAPAAKAFAVEREYMGMDMNMPYAVGDTVKTATCPSGVRVNALIATGQAVSKGGLLESAGNGTLRALAAGSPLARALEALNNTSGANARLRVEVL